MEVFLGGVRLRGGIVLQGKTVDDACIKALDAIKNVLPEEAQSYEAFDYILGCCKDTFLRTRKVVL